MKLTREECYQAILDKNTAYEGIFFTAVKTTGVFCHPTCPARKPKLENCLFFETADEALAAGFRPCKRCRPLDHPNRVPEIVQTLVEAVESDPQRKWTAADLRAYYADASNVRRMFKKRFDMTFVAYARARRMDAVAARMKSGASVIDSQLAAGYDSGSGFRDAFARVIGAAPARLGTHDILKAAWFDTKLGPMIAIADDAALYLLEFADRRRLENEIAALRKRARSSVVPGCTAPIESIQAELASYFAGKLRQFKTPVAFTGSDFQKSVWEELRQTPFGRTRAYAEVAAAVGRPTAVRAVARANGANVLAIIVPCHRVIGSNGELTGYGGGLVRKAWLLEHEAKHAAD